MKVTAAYADKDRAFPLVLDLIPLGDGINWVLEKPFRQMVRVNGVLRTITAPSGLITDLTSIPGIVRPLIGGPWGRYGFGAVIHDFLYQSGRYPRSVADYIFWLGMDVCDVERWRMRLIYEGVRLGGWKVYNGYREMEKRGINVLKYRKEKFADQLIRLNKLSLNS